MLGQGGWQEDPRVGHQAIVVEGRIEAIEAVRRSHRSGVLLVALGVFDHRHHPNSEGT